MMTGFPSVRRTRAAAPVLVPEAPEVQAVLRDFGPALARIAASYERDRAGREDLLQDIAIALIQALPRFRGESALSTFVFRVATNQAIDRIARRSPATLGLEHASALVDPKPTPAAVYGRSERRERLLRAVQDLPLSLRQVIALILEGLSHAEVAAVLGITENNVAVRANRARARLRTVLEDDGA